MTEQELKQHRHYSKLMTEQGGRYYSKPFRNDFPSCVSYNSHGYDFKKRNNHKKLAKEGLITA